MAVVIAILAHRLVEMPVASLMKAVLSAEALLPKAKQT
jgi:hypothetical protein